MKKTGECWWGIFYTGRSNTVVQRTHSLPCHRCAFLRKGLWISHRLSSFFSHLYPVLKDLISFFLVFWVYKRFFICIFFWSCQFVETWMKIRIWYMFKSRSYVEVYLIFSIFFLFLKVLTILIHKLQVALNILSFNYELHIHSYIYFFLFRVFLNTQLSLSNIL